MSLAAFLPDLPELVLEQAIIGDKLITLVVCLTSMRAICPVCTQASQRVHSYSRRTLLDLPFSGHQVLLSLQVRRFRCLTPTCLRSTQPPRRCRR